MKAYWSQLNEREQVIVGLGGVFGIAMLFYFLVYAPLVSAVDNAKAGWRERKDTIQWMEQAARSIRTNQYGRYSTYV
jgi:general secretion pathway protein M